MGGWGCGREGKEGMGLWMGGEGMDEVVVGRGRE